MLILRGETILYGPTEDGGNLDPSSPYPFNPPTPRKTSTSTWSQADDVANAGPNPAASGNGDTTWWPWVVGGILIVGGGLATWRLTRKRRG